MRIFQSKAKMLEIYYNNKWIQFIAIKGLNYETNTDELDERPYSELPDKVYGKYLYDFPGWRPCWTYLTVEKDKLREI